MGAAWRTDCSHHRARHRPHLLPQFYNYEKTYRQLNVSRITVVARDLRQAIETGLNVGLAPRNNTELDKALKLGIRDAGVFDHAAAISEKLKDQTAAAGYQRKARELRP